MNGKLYVVATPIGNLGDITERAKLVLAEVDIIAAEDTRTTQKLFRLIKIHNTTVQNHKFNERQQQEYLIGELKKGKNIAVVSDAGTPCISDPGSILVQGAIEAGVDVIGVCGANSVITALSVSGFEITSFSFSGFLPRTEKDIRTEIKRMAGCEIPIAVYFESPKRIKRTMALLSSLLPNADLCLCNDLTKQFERIYRGCPTVILAELESNPSSEKGEYTLVIRMRNKKNPVEPESISTPEALLIDYIIKTQCSMKDAITALTGKYRGVMPRKCFYTASLHLKEIVTDSKQF